MRVTRLNSCGQPVYGDPCGMVVTKGFVSVEMSVETEDSDDISVTNAAGETCVSEAGCQQISYREVTMTFCQVDPALVTIINPTWKVEKDDDGNIVGWRGTKSLSCETGYALEIWTDVAGDKAAACQGQAAAQGLYGYLLLPYVTGGVPGDLTIENDAVSFEFVGRTKVAGGWGVGPYNVIINGGAPGPLAEPMADDEDHLLRLTTVRPPDAKCGCQPITRPIPPAPKIYVEGVDGEDPRMTARVRVNNNGFGPVTVSFGDGTETQTIPDNTWVTHTYTANGNYTITAADEQTPVNVATRDVTVPLPPDLPALTVKVGDNPQKVVLTWDNHGNGPVKIDWGDGTTPADGADAGVVSYTYSTAGVYTITVTDADEPTRFSSATVAVPVPAKPVFTVAQGGDDKSAKVTGDDANGTAVFYVDWGDGTKPVATRLGKTDTVSHSYGKDGDYVITVTLTTNPLATDSKKITIPFAVPVPTIDTIDPATGAAAGGTQVTITGTNLTGSTAVTFDGTDGTAFDVESDTQIKVTTPAHAAGAVDVVVKNPSGDATKTGGFTYGS